MSIWWGLVALAVFLIGVTKSGFGIGAGSVFLVSLNWYREWRARHAPPAYRPSLAKSTAVGAFAGVSSTLAHAAGPIIALHLLPQRLERGVFVGTCAVYFFLVNTAK